MMYIPLSEFCGTDATAEELEAFRKAYAKHISRVYVPAGLRIMPDGRYLVELRKAKTSAGCAVFSSNDLGAVEHDLIYWESCFSSSAPGQGDYASAFVLGSFMDETGDWHYYAVVTHIGEPTVKRGKTVTEYIGAQDAKTSS